MSASPHPIAPEEIMAHLDGELAPERSQSVSAHLDSCAACQELMNSLRNTSQSLSSWTVGSVTTSLEGNVMLAAAKDPLRPPFAGSRLSTRTRRWTLNQWLGGLAATATALLLLFFIATPNRMRSRMASGPALNIASQRRELAEKRKSSINLDGQLDSDRSTKQEQQAIGDSTAELSLRIPEKGKNSIGVRQNAIAQSSAEQGYKSWLQNGPMIARSVSLSIISKDFDAARGSLDSILARHNGYAADLNVATPQGAARSLQASLRIPAPQLASALAELKSLGRVELEAQNGEEVTQQHADLVARLKNSRETEQRLQAILTQRTGKISDVLSVEQEIARVRGEIEQMEAEQKNLEHRVDFATIDLKLSEEYKAKLDSPAPAISTLIHNAAVNGYRNVADSLLSIVLFFAEYGPVLCFWLLLLAIPAWLVRRRWRHATAAI
jgi:hypothetical protein